MGKLMEGRRQRQLRARRSTMRLTRERTARRRKDEEHDEQHGVVHARRRQRAAGRLRPARTISGARDGDGAAP